MNNESRHWNQCTDKKPVRLFTAVLISSLAIAAAIF